MRRAIAAEERFLDKVLIGDGCWQWTAKLSAEGYGHIREPGFFGRTREAHRFAYEFLRGPIPPGLVIDHLCRNRGCVRPSHMEPVTNGENVRRGESITTINRNRTVCRLGHPLESAIFPSWLGKRGCRECHRRLTRESMERRRRMKKLEERDIV